MSAPAGFPASPVPAPGSAQVYPNPLDQPDAWGTFALAGQPSPGLARVSGAGAPRKLDKKAGHGTSGATVTYTGDELSDFTVTIELLETEDWNAWWTWRALLAKPPAGAKASALPCSHPALDPLGISACLVKEEHQPEPQGDDGMWTVKIDFTAWQKPTPALGTPKGSGYASSFGGPRDPLDTLNHWTNAIKGQLAGLPGGP